MAGVENIYLVGSGMAAVVLALLLFIATAHSIAPNDAFSYCLERSGTIPTFRNEKVLLDTQNYNSTSLLTPNGEDRIWLSLDLDGDNIGGFFNKVNE